MKWRLHPLVKLALTVTGLGVAHHALLWGVQRWRAR